MSGYQGHELSKIPRKSQKIFSKQTFSQSDSKLKDSRKDTVYKERRSFSKSRWVSQPFWAKSWMENKFLEKLPKNSYRSQSSFWKSKSKFFDKPQNLLKISTLKTQIDDAAVPLTTNTGKRRDKHWPKEGLSQEGFSLQKPPSPNNLAELKPGQPESLFKFTERL